MDVSLRELRITRRRNIRRNALGRTSALPYNEGGVESDEEFAARRVGRQVGRFRLESVLGVGGMAAVYLARGADGSAVAVKVLHPDVGIRPDVKERFFREGFIANQLNHTSVVRALE